LKLLFILHLPPPVHGASLVGSFIQQSAHINGVFDTRYINLGTSEGIASIGQHSWKKWLRLARIKAQVIRQLLQFKPDLVYLTLTSKGMGFYKDAIIALLVKALGFQVVYHFHNKGVKTLQHRSFDNWLYKNVFRNAHVILLSPLLYDDIQFYVPEEHVHYCPNGIPDHAQTAERLETDPGHPQRFLFLSNLIESKGVWQFVEACALLKARGLAFEGIMVGAPGDITAETLQQRISTSDLGDRVNYLGPLYGDELKKTMASIDVLVHPSLDDCLPLVLLEAMSAAKPVIASDVGSIPDVIDAGKTGFVTPSGDATAIADYMSVLIADPSLRQEMSKNARRRYEERYTLEAFERRFVEVIRLIETTS